MNTLQLDNSTDLSKNNQDNINILDKFEKNIKIKINFLKILFKEKILNISEEEQKNQVFDISDEKNKEKEDLKNWYLSLSEEEKQKIIEGNDIIEKMKLASAQMGNTESFQ